MLTGWRCGQQWGSGALGAARHGTHAVSLAVVTFPALDVPLKVLALIAHNTSPLDIQARML